MTEQSEEQDPNTLSLEAREYGKIDTIHCGVTRDGMISIGGRQYEMEDGAKVDDEISRISATRKGEQYSFVRA